MGNQPGTQSGPIHPPRNAYQRELMNKRKNFKQEGSSGSLGEKQANSPAKKKDSVTASTTDESSDFSASSSSGRKTSATASLLSLTAGTLAAATVGETKKAQAVIDKSQDEIDAAQHDGRRNSVVKDALKEAAHALKGAKSPLLSSRHIRKPSMDAMASFFPGRRSRRSSEDHGGVNINIKSKDTTPTIPSEEIFDPRKEDVLLEADDDDDFVPRTSRARAATIGNAQTASMQRKAALAAAAEKARGGHFRRNRVHNNGDPSPKVTPTVFRFSGSSLPRSSAPSSGATPNEPKIFIFGTMTDWKPVAMSRPKGESDFLTIVECQPGQVFFKFNVDGAWVHDGKQATRKRDKDSRQWNTLHVKRSDHDVFEALACDSFALKDDRTDAGNQNDEDRAAEDKWSQDKPNETFMSQVKNRGPPLLPPHLLQVLLNKETSDMSDPVLLPEPTQVCLDHLYAQSIRDNMLVMSTTTRFRKKFITMVLYRPI